MKKILRLVEVVIIIKRKIHSVPHKNQVNHATQILVKMADFVHLIKHKTSLYVFAPRYIQGIKLKLVRNYLLYLPKQIFLSTYCDRYKYSDSNIGKSLAIDEKTNRLKRIAQMNFLIEYLIVVDKTVVDQFNSIYQSLGNENINDYIRIMYSHLVNGV